MLLRAATLADGRVVDVHIVDGLIASVDDAGASFVSPQTPDSGVCGDTDGGSKTSGAPTPAIDLSGHLLLPAFAEPHAHLDKAFLSERIPNPTGDLMGAIIAMSASRHLVTFGDTVERAERAVRLMVSNGATLIRSHADTTLENGLLSVQALAEVRRRVADICDIQIVALVTWPVTGAAGAETRALLADALDAGADIVGGCPHLEDDPHAANEVLLGIASAHGRDVDLHTDETLDDHKLSLDDLAHRVHDSGFSGRVTASHCVSLAMQPEIRQRHVADAVAMAGISVVALPHTNLFLQGREHQFAMPRALTAIKALRAAGVNVCAGADNLQDPFNPLGRGDPLETAALMVLAGHLLPIDALASVTGNAWAALTGAAHTIAAGQPAELVAVPSASVREAIAFGPPARIVIHQGRVVSS